MNEKEIIEILKDMAVAVMTAEPTKLEDLDNFGFEFFVGLIEAKSKEEAKGRYNYVLNLFNERKSERPHPVVVKQWIKLAAFRKEGEG